ncbi:hypothetical protein HY411_00985 [Candidatus Gottesmanbacteria bacterium]|nr:hypothetical protein [Candidatus Gottesmanbacteria bacterium]
MVDVTPALFTDDLEALKDQIVALRSHVSWIQLDLSDGTMVPAKTFFALDTLAALVTSDSSVSFEAHLMVDNPVKYLKPLVDAGFKRIIAQVEASDPRHFLDEAQLESVEVGLALDGVSELPIIEPFLESVDLVVIMTVEAGVPNGRFLPESLEKIKAIRHHFPDLAIAAEGNIDERSGKLLRDVGVSRLVVAADAFLKDTGSLVARLENLRGT